MIVFACFSPHPPLLLPGIGEKEDKERVRKTISALKKMGEGLRSKNPDRIIISSPHPDWGFNVPLYFLAKGFEGEIKSFLIGGEPPSFYFKKGKLLSSELEQEKRYALIASGDLSHRLLEEGPYGFHSDGPKFDKALLECLEKKDLDTLFKLDELYPEAGECGLRSFCFLLGILEGAGVKWQADILSYEGPFGVGYLTLVFKF